MTIEYYKTKSCLLRLMLLESGLHDQNSLSKKLQLSTSGTKKLIKNFRETSLTFVSNGNNKDSLNFSIRKQGHGKTRFFALNNDNIDIANLILTVLYKQTALKKSTFRNYLSILILLSNNSNSLSKVKLELELFDKFSNYYSDSFDITKPLETLVSMGVLVTSKQKGSAKKYAISDFYTNLKPETLAKLVVYLNFITKKDLFCVQGLLLHSTLQKYLKNNKIALPKTKLRNFISANILDEYIADILLKFISTSTPLKIIYSPNNSTSNYNPKFKKIKPNSMSVLNGTSDKKIFFINPLFIIHDQFNCRWYLLGESLYKKNKILNLRLDNIIHIQEASKEILKLKNFLTLNSSSYSPSTLSKLNKQLLKLTTSYRTIKNQNSNYIHENSLNLKDKLKYSWQCDFSSPICEIKILFFTANNLLLKKRLNREKQWGHLRINEEQNTVFTIKVRGLQEIRPWIYSFGSDAKVLSPLELKTIIKNKFLEVLSFYE